MKVVKKSGTLQEYDESKVLTSVVNAASDTEEMSLNESDIKVLVEDVTHLLKEIRRDGSNTSSFEITGVVSFVLLRDGFGKILEAFMNYE